MAKTVQITIKESSAELRKLLQQQPLHLKSRIQMLLLLRTNAAMTKQGLATALSVNPNTAQSWRTKYRKGGMDGLLAYSRGGNKPSLISAPAHEALKVKLQSSQDAFRSYTELQHWMDEHFVPRIKYSTINSYVKRHFRTKLKVARKSHIRKDGQAREGFLKNRTGAKTH